LLKNEPNFKYSFKNTDVLSHPSNKKIKKKFKKLKPEKCTTQEIPLIIDSAIKKLHSKRTRKCFSQPEASTAFKY